MVDRFSVHQKHIHVTGASSGLGRHFVTMLAGQGARVSFGARRLDRIVSLAQDLNEAGHEAFSVACDVTSEGSIVAAISSSEDAFGPIDVLINNAGTSIPKPVLETTLDEWNAVLDTNLGGVWIASQEVARRAVGRGRACSIINIASIAGIRTYARVSAYVASKAAVIQLTKNMAVELARQNVRINAIAPGFFDTELGEEFRKHNPDRRREQVERIPMGRVGEHAELDGAVMLLASDASSYMTGSVIVVDGGHAESGL